MCYRLLLALALSVGNPNKVVTGARRRLDIGDGSSITYITGSDPAPPANTVPDYVISKAGAYTCPHQSRPLLSKSNCDIFSLDSAVVDSPSSAAEVDVNIFATGCVMYKGDQFMYWNTGSLPDTSDGHDDYRLVCTALGRSSPYWYGDAGSADCPAGSVPVTSSEDCKQYTVQDQFTTWNNVTEPRYMASMGNPANSDKIAPGCNVNIDENIVLWNENTENTAGHDDWRRICRDPLPVPAPTLFPTASPTPTAAYTEETCGGENLHRYPSLESCCDDLGLPEHQEDLTAFLEDLEGDALTSFTDKCAEHYSR